MMPGKSRSPACSLRTRLSRISCLTDRVGPPRCRSSPRVCIEGAISQFYLLYTSLVSHAFFQSARPLVFAHRGGSALAPENTITAFDNGLAHGADGLELDVRLSRDGIAVVHHDPTLERTTTLTGPLDRLTADELAKGNVPTLDRVLERYRDARLIVELKVN